MPTELVGNVRVVGDWLEVHFTYDLDVVHALRGLNARRLELGVWRVPNSELPKLARRLEPFNFRWEGPASVLHKQARDLEATLQKEDQLALLAKAGGRPLGAWNPPVALMSHQRLAVEFLAVRRAALLCDEQGLGKTLSALVAFWRVKSGGHANQLVVLCPNSLKYTWRDEIARFFPAWKVSVARGYKGHRRRAYNQRADVYIANYEAVRSDYSEIRLLLRRSTSVLVCDESHAAKNTDSQLAWALSFVRSAAARIWMMSGTPVTNRPEDCFAQVSIADGGRTLGTKTEFWARFVDHKDRESTIQDLQVLLRPVLLRRTKEEALDLPDKVFEVRHVELKGEQARLYRAFRDQLYTEVEAMSEEEFRAATASIFTRMLRLAQIASNPRLVIPSFVGDSAKMREIDALLEELIDGNNRKVVLWSHYVRSIEEFIQRYRRYSPVAIYGDVPLDARRDAVKRFQEDDSSMLFVGNPQAAGTGLTLTAAQYAIYETLTWRYDLYAQSIDRTHRIGQTRNVTYFTLLALNTIDLAIAQSLEKKRQMAGYLLGDSSEEPRFGKSEVLAMLHRPSHEPARGPSLGSSVSEGRQDGSDRLSRIS